MPYVISEYDVGPKFAARAIAHFKETGEPLMEYQRRRYKIVLGTESSFTSCGGYALTNPKVEAEPSLSWRELSALADSPLSSGVLRRIDVLRYDVMRNDCGNPATGVINDEVAFDLPDRPAPARRSPRVGQPIETHPRRQARQPFSRRPLRRLSWSRSVRPEAGNCSKRSGVLRLLHAIQTFVGRRRTPRPVLNAV